MSSRAAGILVLGLTLFGCNSESQKPAESKKSPPAPAVDTKEQVKITAFMLEGDERRPVKFEQSSPPYEIVISESETLIVNAAVKIERTGDKIKVSIRPLPAGVSDPSVDGCWVNSSGVCHNDGNCSQTCLLRTYDGYYYCVCGNQ